MPLRLFCFCAVAADVTGLPLASFTTTAGEMPCTAIGSSTSTSSLAPPPSSSAAPRELSSTTAVTAAPQGPRTRGSTSPADALPADDGVEGRRGRRLDDDGGRGDGRRRCFGGVSGMMEGRGGGGGEGGGGADARDLRCLGDGGGEGEVSISSISRKSGDDDDDGGCGVVCG